MLEGGRKGLEVKSEEAVMVLSVKVLWSKKLCRMFERTLKSKFIRFYSDEMSQNLREGLLEVEKN